MGFFWSGRPDSNRRHSAWKADTLPTELLPRAALKGLDVRCDLAEYTHPAANLQSRQDRRDPLKCHLSSRMKGIQCARTYLNPPRYSRITGRTRGCPLSAGISGARSFSDFRAGGRRYSAGTTDLVAVCCEMPSMNDRPFATITLDRHISTCSTCPIQARVWCASPIRLHDRRSTTT